MHEYTEGEREGVGRCVTGGWKMGEMVCIGKGGGGKEEEEGCSAAVERSERRLQSLLMGEIRLCYHSSEEL